MELSKPSYVKFNETYSIPMEILEPYNGGNLGNQSCQMLQRAASETHARRNEYQNLLISYDQMLVKQVTDLGRQPLLSSSSTEYSRLHPCFEDRGSLSSRAIGGRW